MTSRVSDDGQRLIDLSELIRVYGEPPHSVTPDTPLEVPRGDTTDTPRDDMIVEELRALRQEVRDLRQEVHELRRLPAPESPQKELPPDQQSEKNTSPITSFDDLLERFERRH
jgi:flagellar biogenesis protein FliO